MLIKLYYDKMVFIGQSSDHELDVEKFAGKTIVISNTENGLEIKGSKGDMFDLLAKLAYKYDIEIN